MRKLAALMGVACVLTAAMAQPSTPAPTPTQPAQPAAPAPEAPKTDQPAKDATGEPTNKPAAEPKKEAGSTLKVGDAAPAFKPEAWLKGKQVKSFEAGKVYVVEFWAISRPYREGVIPHLTKLQKDNPGLTVIWLANAEPFVPANRKEKARGDQRQNGVADYVRKERGNIDYRVAFDSQGIIWKDWMKAAGKEGTPCAFIIGHDLKVAFIGDPVGMEAEVSKALKAAEEAAKAAKKPATK